MVLRAVLVGALIGLVFLFCRLRGADVRLALAGFVVSAVTLDCGRSCSGWCCLRWCSSCLRCAAIGLASSGRFPDRRRLGEPPRQLLPRSMVVGLAQLEDVAQTEARRPSPVHGRRRVGGRRHDRPVRATGLAVCRRPVDQIGGHRPDHRAATDHAPDRSGCCSSPRRSGRCPWPAAVTEPPGQRCSGSPPSSSSARTRSAAGLVADRGGVRGGAAASPP